MSNINKNFQKVTMEELNALPKRNNCMSIYEHLIIIPTDRVHENGWGIIKLIGVDKDNNAEVITETSCDILTFAVKHSSIQHIECFKIDLLPTAKVFKIFSAGYQFKVGIDGWTVDIKLILKRPDDE